jgi:HD-GYP domain-containing protein (c-di-GMP phosphodiesterase class II)
VADAFDAMTSDRPYRSAIPVEAAWQEIKRCSGTQFDPVVVSAFIKIKPFNSTIEKSKASVKL